MHPDIKGLECPERRRLPKVTWSRYPQSGGYSYVSLTDKGSQLFNRNLSKASIGLPRKALQCPKSPPHHMSDLLPPTIPQPHWAPERQLSPRNVIVRSFIPLVQMSLRCKPRLLWGDVSLAAQFAMFSSTWKHGHARARITKPQA